MNEFKDNREGKLEELKKDIAKKKTALAKQTAEVKAVQREVQTAELELEQMDKDIASAGEEVQEARQGVNKIEQELKELERAADKTQSEHTTVEKDLKEETKMLSSFQNELEELDRVRKTKEAEIGNLEAEEKKHTHEIERLSSDAKKVLQSLEQLSNKYTWIEDDSASFGKAGTMYDFSTHDMEKTKMSTQQLAERQQGRSKKINPKVMMMIETVEKQEKELIRNHSQVLKDKEKIEQTVAKLDNYKKEALTKTWEKVNGDFGAIFGELLPGNFSKLQPPEGMDITQGLEVKVRLGQVWKQSLTELSGGQR